MMKDIEYYAYHSIFFTLEHIKVNTWAAFFIWVISLCKCKALEKALFVPYFNYTDDQKWPNYAICTRKEISLSLRGLKKYDGM